MLGRKWVVVVQRIVEVMTVGDVVGRGVLVVGARFEQETGVEPPRFRVQIQNRLFSLLDLFHKSISRTFV